MNTDNYTSYAKKALDLLFLNNPIGTSLGVLFGLICYSFIPAFDNIVIYYTGLNLVKVSYIGWIAFGVFIFNLPSWLFYPRLPKDIAIQLRVIEEGKKAGLSKLELKQQYRNLIQQYMNNIIIDQKSTKENAGFADN